MSLYLILLPHLSVNTLTDAVIELGTHRPLDQMLHLPDIVRTGEIEKRIAGWEQRTFGMIVESHIEWRVLDVTFNNGRPGEIDLPMDAQTGIIDVIDEMIHKAARIPTMDCI